MSRLKCLLWPSLVRRILKFSHTQSHSALQKSSTSRQLYFWITIFCAWSWCLLCHDEKWRCRYQLRGSCLFLWNERKRAPREHRRDKGAHLQVCYFPPPYSTKKGWNGNESRVLTRGEVQDGKICNALTRQTLERVGPSSNCLTIYATVRNSL